MKEFTAHLIFASAVGLEVYAGWLWTKMIIGG